MTQRKKLTVSLEADEYANVRTFEASIASQIEHSYPVGHSDFFRALIAEYVVNAELRESVTNRVRSGEFFRVRGAV